MSVKGIHTTIKWEDDEANNCSVARHRGMTLRVGVKLGDWWSEVGPIDNPIARYAGFRSFAEAAIMVIGFVDGWKGVTS